MKEDIKKVHKELYDVSVGRLEEVHVPEFTYLRIKGYGNPRTPEFKAQMTLMRMICKEIKKYYKNTEDPDHFVSAPIEGVWKTYGEQNIDIAREANIRYSLQVVVPDDFTEEILEELMHHLVKSIKTKAKREQAKDDVSKMDMVYTNMVPFINGFYVVKHEIGHCIQTLHVGPYDQEIKTTSQLMEFITISNLRLRGLHHEIYLNDYTKVTPDRLKTIIRYPIE